MLFYAFVFLVTALLSGFAGFTDLSGSSASTAQMMCMIFSTLFVLAFHKMASKTNTQNAPYNSRPSHKNRRRAIAEYLR